MEILIRLILLFFLYSFAGWCIEVMLKYIQFHRFINRGFFTGPICPIYGSGALLITLAAQLLAPYESAYGTTFALSFLLCGTVEYLTSYLLEKHYHARWWDYSRKPMNLHGRVWIGNLVLFGLGGVAIVHFINPSLDRLLEAVSLPAREIVVFALLVLFAVDYAGTHIVLKLIKTGVESSQADDTEEIRQEMQALLSDHSALARRFAEAYPDVVYRTERINARIAEVKAETERLRQEAEAHVSEHIQQISERLEPSIMIKNNIIAQQDELIEKLYDENCADDTMKALKASIDREKRKLDSKPFARTIFRKQDHNNSLTSPSAFSRSKRP